MTRPFDAASVLAHLTSFQNATVAHVMKRLHSDEGTRRFLVADETGLGKSMVARGVIARTIERLQGDSSVGRIDIIYVCSNRDLARQNLSRLDVLGGSNLPVADRLTMLAAHTHRFDEAPTVGGKGVNLVSFTPGTSFDMGWRTGQAPERALLFLLLEGPLGLTGYTATAGLRLLQGTVHRLETFRRSVETLRADLVDGLNVTIADSFAATAQSSGLLRRFVSLVEQLGRRRALTDEETKAAKDLTGELRAALARASVDALKPDLIILDEFQRFRHLLDPEEPAGELAHALFEHGEARVLLLSATPYKPFTYAEERADDEDHYRDLFETLGFLAEGSPVDVSEIRQHLATYREQTMTGDDSSAAAREVTRRLTELMCRTERPSAGEVDMLAEVADSASDLRADDMLGYAVLQSIAREVDAPMPVDYWKSVPYFVNFLERYQIGGKLRDALRDPAARARLRPLLRHAQQLDRKVIERFGPVDFGSPRLRALASDLFDAGAWRLLWLPASLPYHQPGTPFDSQAVVGLTKRLVFSSWAATPTSIAALLSYEAERRIADGTRWTQNTSSGRESIATRLDFRLREDGVPASMTTLALFFPNPALASATDPLNIARERPAEVMKLSYMESAVAPVVRRLLDGLTPNDMPLEQQHWSAPFGLHGATPDIGLDEMAHALAGAPTGQRGERALRSHVEMATATQQRSSHDERARGELVQAVVQLGLHGPGNVAYRALGRLIRSGDAITAEGHWCAAAVVASALRSVFNRPDATVLLDRLDLQPGQPYWRNVLAYCGAGNLQAVLDEYLHHLASSETRPTTDAALLHLAELARDAISLRPSSYEAFDWRRPDKPITMTSRFALRYAGQGRADDSERPSEVRKAFNSPFWPFVLATTSAGQEGIDFHWWCHAVVHWNTPANPVDFEQREGRVNRYAGHAIRKNVAARHRTSILASRTRDPWEAAYAHAVEYREEYGDLSPHWVYPGDAKIQRHALPLPLSRDVARLDRIRQDVVLYRLAFGQPRQEDLLELLRRRGHADVTTALLDLRPPRPDEATSARDRRTNDVEVRATTKASRRSDRGGNHPLV
jgi:hypothetical protein